MTTTSTIETRCSKVIGRGTCRNEAQYMVNGEPRCPEHTPKASDKFDVMPLNAPAALPPCLCGCGLSVLKLGRTYRQGHDQKHRGILLRRVREMADAEAASLLVRKGWKSRAEADEMLEAAIERTGMIVNAEGEPDEIAQAAD